jgi:hypothetical protein
VAEELRSEGVHPDLVIGNNVMAHVPELGDFVDGLAVLAGDSGLVTLEFPHLLRLLEAMSSTPSTTSTTRTSRCSR